MKTPLSQLHSGHLTPATVQGSSEIGKLLLLMIPMISFHLDNTALLEYPFCSLQSFFTCAESEAAKTISKSSFTHTHTHTHWNASGVTVYFSTLITSLFVEKLLKESVSVQVHVKKKCLDLQI